MITKEKKVKAAEACAGAGAGGGGGEALNLEALLGELGSFGRYQLLLLMLLAFRDSFLNMCNFNYVFTAAAVPHRCVVPECEDIDSRFAPSWGEFALLPDAHACRRPAPLATSTISANGSCSPAAFDPTRTVPCTDLLYRDYNSLVAEFDLGCEPWKRTLVGTVHNMGLVFSFIFFGFISDRYGRKVVIVVTPLLVGAFGLAKSCAPSYWLLLALEFLEAALGYGNASLVLSLETVSHKRRVAFSCLGDMLSSVGGALLGLVAWLVPAWRWLVRAIYAPLLMVAAYGWLVDEGVRWLVARGRRKEAASVLRKVARTNGVTLSASAAAALAAIAAPCPPRPHQPQKQPVRAVLRSRVMAWRVALMAACFFGCALLYNGALVLAGGGSATAGVSGDRHVDFAVLLLAAVPTRAVTALTLTRFGRRAPVALAYLLCAGCFAAAALAPRAAAALLVAGVMCASYGMFALHVVAMEVFPTTARNSLTNVAYTVGRLGAVLAPQLPLLAQYAARLPSVVFAGVALAVAVLALLLPDASRAALPDDVAAAERVDNADADADATADADAGKPPPPPPA